jgi:hypothetical protein
MQSKHKLDGPMRSYLLGKIDDAEAVKLEERYFADPSALRSLHSVENALIEDYFENRLSSKDKQLFESRYLEVPALKQKVEEVRIQRELAAPNGKRANWFSLPFVAAAMVLCIVGLGSWFYWSQRGAQPAVVARAPLPSPVAALNLRLSPGVTKGGTGRVVEAAIPAKGSRVTLSLELPGRKPIDSYLVRILTVGANGDSELVWTSGAVHPEPRDGGSVLNVEPDSSIFQPADYLVQASALTGEVVETYQFRVNPTAH